MARSLKLMFSLALRFLGLSSRQDQSHARKSLHSAIWGIGISIVPLVIVLVVSDGMIEGITGRMIELGTGQLQLVDVQPLAEDETNTERYALLEHDFSHAQEVLLKDPRVKNVWLHIQGEGIVIGKNGRKGGTIRAVSQSFFTDNDRIKDLLSVESGRLELENDDIILGKVLAEELQLQVGQTCRIITLHTNKKGSVRPAVLTATVRAIVSSGYQELDALWVFLPLSRAKKSLSLDTSLASVMVQMDDPFNPNTMEAVIQRAQAVLPQRYVPYTWQDMNKSQFHSFETSKKLIIFIMILIVAVASVNISSALIMLIMERKREMAMLKAMGFSHMYITGAFLSAGVFTSIAGLCIGLPIGIAMALSINTLFTWIDGLLNAGQYLIYASIGSLDAYIPIHILNPAYYLAHIPIVLRFKELYNVVVGTVLLSIVVCLIPAIKAGRARPLEIMRKL